MKMKKKLGAAESRGYWEWAGVAAVIGVHVLYLLHTTFVDWPEMLVYPWFLTRHLLYYRDVVLAYVPGSYYILYALYSMLGFSVKSERIIAYLFIFLTDIFVYIAAKKLTKSRVWALAGMAFFIFWQPILSGNTIWYETMLAPVYLGAFLAALSYLEKPSGRRAVVLGLLLALASVIKQTAAWSITLVCLFVWLSDRKKSVGFWRAVTIGILPVGANLLFWAYFALLGAGKQYFFWAYGFLLMLSHGSSMYMLPPTRGDIAFIAPAFVPIALALFLFRKNKTITLLFLWTAALIMAGLPRWGIHRLQPALAFAALGFSSLLPYFWTKKYPARLIAGILIAAFVFSGSYRSIRLFVNVRDRMQPQFFGTPYQKLVDFVRYRFAGPFWVMGNDDYIYFGLDRTPWVLPWVPLFPWNAEVPGLEQDLIRSIDRQQIPYILYIPYHGTRGYYDSYRPEALYLYLTSKYEKIAPVPAAGGWLYARK